jgi:hypothetical protein
VIAADTADKAAWQQRTNATPDGGHKRPSARPGASGDVSRRAYNVVALRR